MNSGLAKRLVVCLVLVGIGVLAFVSDWAREIGGTERDICFGRGVPAQFLGEDVVLTASFRVETSWIPAGARCVWTVHSGTDVVVDGPSWTATLVIGACAVGIVLVVASAFRSRAGRA